MNPFSAQTAFAHAETKDHTPISLVICFVYPVTEEEQATLDQFTGKKMFDYVIINNKPVETIHLELGQPRTRITLDEARWKVTSHFADSGSILAILIAPRLCSKCGRRIYKQKEDGSPICDYCDNKPKKQR